MGLSGLGDLVLTATSKSSRNFAYGVALGAGAAPGGALAEGVDTAPALATRAKAMGVELPIAEAVADLVSGALSPGEAVLRLLSRKVTVE
jgi:glycerol-3-phosphate dehydrogenase (NAD(P)+)